MAELAERLSASELVEWARFFELRADAERKARDRAKREAGPKRGTSRPPSRR